VGDPTVSEFTKKTASLKITVQGMFVMSVYALVVTIRSNCTSKSKASDDMRLAQYRKYTYKGKGVPRDYVISTARIIGENSTKYKIKDCVTGQEFWRIKDNCIVFDFSKLNRLY
jgi:hypothetical protein